MGRTEGWGKGEGGQRDRSAEGQEDQGKGRTLPAVSSRWFWFTVKN